ncbi:hypothetical protein [Kyrpidia spormannii]|nr:hypothetical protein [Kyrpidia spormannii]
MDKPKRLAPMKTIHEIELPEKSKAIPTGKPKRLAPLKTIYDLGYQEGSHQEASLPPALVPMEPAVASQEPVKAPAYVVTADGSPVASLGSMAEALEALAAVVRSTPSRPGHTVRIEIRDAAGKPLRICYLPRGRG